MRRSKIIVFSFLVALVEGSAQTTILSRAADDGECNDNDRSIHPILCDMMDLVRLDPLAISQVLHDWAKAHHRLADITTTRPLSRTDTIQRRLGSTRSTDSNSRTLEVDVPVVLAHGMGDSCFNTGMQRITSHVSQLLHGAYTTCIPIGDSETEDTNNGYFLNMDASVEIFANAVRQNVKLNEGFHAIGFSQGNNIIRGYITKYNDPPVKTFLSINGVNAGEGAVPYCRPSSVAGIGMTMCDLLMEQASRAAYTEYAQKHSFQANYWRDPRPSEFPTYQKYAQLAKWNNEGLGGVNQTYKDNFLKTETYVWIMAMDDAMVWPKEGEQWGAPDPTNPFQHILPREETEWYINDLFGLKSAEEAGKNHYESFQGDHLQFSMEDFDGWVTKYLV